MALVTSGSDLTVFVLDNSEVEQLRIVMQSFASHQPFPAALFELADALDIETYEEDEDLDRCANGCVCTPEELAEMNGSRYPKPSEVRIVNGLALNWFGTVVTFPCRCVVETMSDQTNVKFQQCQEHGGA